MTEAAGLGKSELTAQFFIDAAFLSLELGLVEEAVGHSRHAISIDASKLDAYLNYAQLLTQINRCSEALDCLNQAHRVFDRPNTSGYCT